MWRGAEGGAGTVTCVGEVSSLGGARGGPEPGRLVGVVGRHGSAPIGINKCVGGGPVGVVGWGGLP